MSTGDSLSVSSLLEGQSGGQHWKRVVTASGAQSQTTSDAEALRQVTWPGVLGWPDT